MRLVTDFYPDLAWTLRSRPLLKRLVDPTKFWYGVRDAHIGLRLWRLLAPAMFHIGVLLQHDGKSSSPTSGDWRPGLCAPDPAGRASSAPQAQPQPHLGSVKRDWEWKHSIEEGVGRGKGGKDRQTHWKVRNGSGPDQVVREGIDDPAPNHNIVGFIGYNTVDWNTGCRLSISRTA